MNSSLVSTRIRRPACSIGRRALAAGRAAFLIVSVLSLPATAGERSQPSLAQAFSHLRISGGPKTVTLITGDKVNLDRQGKVTGILPGPGRKGVSFMQSMRGSDITVTPMDALGLVANGVVDARLFNISMLVRFGYDDARRSTVPTISRGMESGPPGAQAMRAHGVVTARHLDVLNGHAAEVPKAATAAFWDQVKRNGGSARRTDRWAPRLWLDGKRQVLLDQSVAQIGGNAAWAAGYTGRGVTVAVLDTGIDATHPDFAGRIAHNVNLLPPPENGGSPEPNEDLVGHGTHVASTIAGSGAASGGRYRGVAPEATLAIGKVCDQQGCQDSVVIAGMQWAAETARARVISLSLGGPQTPGSDPAEEAIQSLSASTGALFVIAAGNNGCAGRGQTVNSPSTAPAALSVAAVDRGGKIASFSSCGPDATGTVAKPEISAPGVDIVAARAASISPGHVSGGYMALSGTSMATPHVSGAAVLLAQQHPTWNGADIKAVLMGTARRTANTGVFQQGAGIVDMANAIRQTWAPLGEIASFGVQQWPHADDPILVRPLTMRNMANRPIALSLSLQAKAPDGTPAAPGMFYLNNSNVTVPAGGSATVLLTANSRVASPDGVYEIAVTINDGQGAESAHLVLDKEVESYNVTLKHVDRSGTPGTPLNSISVINRLHSFNEWLLAPETGDGTVTVRLPKDSYRILSRVGGANQETIMVAPAFSPTENMTVTIDARKAGPLAITYRDAAPSTSPVVRTIEVTHPGVSSANIYPVTIFNLDSKGQFNFGGIAVPNAPRIASNFAFAVYAFHATSLQPADGNFVLGVPQVSGDVTSYAFAESFAGSVPSGLARTFSDRDLALVRNKVPSKASTGPGSLVHRVALAPFLEGSTYGPMSFLPVAVSEKRDTVDWRANTSAKLRWQPTLQRVDSSSNDIFVTRKPVQSLVRHTEIDWREVSGPYFSSLESNFELATTGYPFRPDFVLGNPTWALAPGTRSRLTDADTSDVMVFIAQPLSSAVGSGDLWNQFNSSDGSTALMTLSMNGSEIARTDGASDPTWLGAYVPRAQGNFVLRMEFSPGAGLRGALGLPSRSASEWNFKSRPTLGSAIEALPLSFVTLGSLVQEGGWWVPLKVFRQAHVQAEPDLLPKPPVVELSFDAGISWKQSLPIGSGANWAVRLPAGQTPLRGLSIRVTATSADGSTAKHTVIGAYQLRRAGLGL